MEVSPEHGATLLCVDWLLVELLWRDNMHLQFLFSLSNNMIELYIT